MKTNQYEKRERQRHRIWVLLIVVATIGLGVSLLAGCGTIPQKNSCLPEALMMHKGLQEKGIKSGVLRIQFKDEGHAITCYELSPTKGYAWDINWGSVPLNPWGWDAEATGLQWAGKWMPNKEFQNATWLEEMK